ncbi:DNA translocase FtsK [Butyrivibrio sp. XB500-5]|uniref:DNA translocase FtsK n=1 Tax=Butyrivibrio sp. XB500-5 TaxID=2364880 RepID=UPI000EAA450C|nr:DNA translocase FtsK [Butyrivibrio sp. XB500-5]RKM59531.1 DNA translocase FtsK [Butyrivibrio sp. XB500-5]
MIKSNNMYDLLDYHNIQNDFTDNEYVQTMKEKLVELLKSYGAYGEIVEYYMTPFAVTFVVDPDSGESIKEFKRLRVDLEVHMAWPIEIVNIVEKEGVFGIVVKRWERPLIGLRDIMESDEFINSGYEIPIAAGMDVLGKPLIFDLAKTPHLLVAGTTGSGKSIFLNDIIMSILLNKTPEEVQLMMVDPKRVEFGAYNGIPHLSKPVIYDIREAVNAVKWLDAEMVVRYNTFVKYNAKDIDAYNMAADEDNKSPRIVMIIDEYMELMYQPESEFEELIQRISRMARASGIHLVLATQRPSKDVITSNIKANIPCRASFTVVDWRESKTILDRTGAEKLLGNGDMLYSEGSAAIPVHAQAAYVSYEEIDRVIDAVRKN